MRLAAVVVISIVAVGFTGAGSAKDAEPMPRLWRDSGPVASKDLFRGAGTALPQPPFAFIKEDTSGTKPKVHVRDAQGMTWNVKFDAPNPTGKEVPTEIAASRIMWALGYLVEESYLVPEGAIDGVGVLHRAASVISPDGRFRSARFERRPPDVERRSKRWTVDANPFIGSKELSGLLVVVALLNNWDFRRGNTDVLRVPAGGIVEDWYIVSDLGSAFGRMEAGSFGKQSRWNLKHYQENDHFVFRVDPQVLELNYRPNGMERARVPMEHARWIAHLASQLTTAQLQQAFRAAGALPEEVNGFSETLAGRIRKLQEATAAR